MEQFAPSWGRWKQSEATKRTNADESDEQLKFDGKWSLEESILEGSALDGDFGLVLKTAAKHHAISVPFEETLDPMQHEDLILQYVHY